MKKHVLIFSIILISFFSIAQTDISYTITSGGIARTYKVYVPAIYNSLNPTPLVFNFHGYTSNNTQQEFYGDFRPIADTANFIIVHPQGLSTSGNTGWANFGTVASASVDVNFTLDMITTISAQYNINQNRIYSTGLSNGGFMSYDLACLLSNKIAAIASVSGGMISTHIVNCNPLHPMPIMQIHGTNDATVSYTGVGGIVSCLHVDTLIKRWVVKNNCNPTPQFTAFPNISTSDNCTAEHYVYTGGTNGSSVELLKVINGGHSWPGSPYPLSGINTNQDFKASNEIWRFFRKNNLSILTSVNESKQSKQVVTVFPNPAKNTLYFNLSSVSQNTNYVIVTDIIGSELINEKTTTNSINIEKLKPGVYFISIKTEEGTFTKTKFIKE